MSAFIRRSPCTSPYSPISKPISCAAKKKPWLSRTGTAQDSPQRGADSGSGDVVAAGFVVIYFIGGARVTRANNIPIESDSH